MPSLHLTKVQQHFERLVVADIPATLAAELSLIAPLIQPGTNIAIAVGSRGVANMAKIVRTTVDFVKAQGASPFIIPAMGSHGGGTAAGQAEVLAGYGVTRAAMDASVRSSLEVVELTRDDSPNRVFMDRYAYEADGIIVINRIKIHTDYHGLYESGLVKMCVIGLGKHTQALEIHSFGVSGLREHIPPTARQILDTGKILAGVAVVENAYDETMLVRVLKAEEIMSEEPKLLDLARANMPCLPVDEVDVLIIDRMGKDISGAGLDPNIIGRLKIKGETEPEAPRIKSIMVSDLTLATHGNAVGVGLADVVTRKLFTKIDFSVTYENAVTSTFFERGKIPLIAQNDAQAYQWALRGCGRIPEGQQKIIRIQDTLHLGEVYVSEAILAKINDRDDIEVISQPVAMFADNGDLRPF
ncbi:MAG: DUF2088 domain-containing protein [Anaerolineae bacterium]|nr:DUF2088 domain-containing protein [Anaerolineae bacterium]